MTHQEFDAFVHRVESDVGRDADRLRRKVAWLAFVGFGGVLLPLFFVVVLAAAFIMPQILWAHEAWGLSVVGVLILLIGSWIALRPLVVKLPRPDGIEIKRADATKLFAALDELRRTLRSAPFHHVLITPECNASVSQRPRLGVFGWYRNYLRIGLPLMEVMSIEEFRFVLAHEFAHLSRQHNRSSQWIYRLRRSWEPVFAQLGKPRTQNEISMRPIIRKFVNWHWPRFNAHAFVLSRAQEYQADAEAARIVGEPTAASALLRVDVCGEALEKTVWAEIWKQSTTAAEPPAGVFENINLSLNGLFTTPTEGLVQNALLQTTTNADTHPCVSDRLQAIGQLSSARQQLILRRNEQSAADLLFGSALSKIRHYVDEEWQRVARDNWKQRHSKANALSDRLQTIEQTAASRAADADRVWDKARVVGQLQGDAAAIPLLKQVLELDPAHAYANFALGQILLKNRDPQGECHIERAIDADEELLPQAADRLHHYFRETGQSEKIRDLYARMDRFENSMTESRAERSNVTSKDTFLHHNLTAEQLSTVCDALAAEADIIQADLAQKQLKHFANQRLYVLSVRVRPAWHRLPNEEKQQSIVGRISKTIQVPGRILIICPNGPFRAVAKKLRKVPTARIFNR